MGGGKGTAAAADDEAWSTGLWIYRDGFSPGTDAVRAQVAEAIVQRTDEVVADVLAAITGSSEEYDQSVESRRVISGLAEYTRQGHLTLADWIRTGDAPTPTAYVQQEVDQDGFLPGTVTGRIARMVRSNLQYGDSTKRILRQEIRRAGGSPELFWALCAGVDIGFRMSLLATATLYDRRNRATEEALAQKEAQLEYQALHDPLTGLANRALLFDRLDHACERLRRHPERGGLGVIFLDVDDFKITNDTYGHTAGDAVLCEVGRRLLAAVRPEDTVARLGGDEFVVMCESVPDTDWAEMVAARITDELSAPFDWGGTTHAIRSSIGTAVGFPPACEVERLVREADDAMYRAKRAGKRRQAGAGARPAG